MGAGSVTDASSWRGWDQRGGTSIASGFLDPRPTATPAEDASTQYQEPASGGSEPAGGGSGGSGASMQYQEPPAVAQSRPPVKAAPLYCNAPLQYTNDPGELQVSIMAMQS